MARSSSAAGRPALSASYWLARAGVDHVVFEKKSIMHKWREERWDTFCLVTPNWQCQLPGHPYDGPDPHGFMVKHEILAYLDGFARKTNASVREGVEVLAVERERDLFLVTTSAGRFLGRRSVSGDEPLWRPLSAAMRRTGPATPSPRFTRPNIATPRPCRRARSSLSGRASRARRSPRICISTAARSTSSPAMRRSCARFYRGRDVVDWLSDIGQYEITVADEGMGRKRHDTNHYLTGRDGGRDIDLRAFAQQGMSLYGRLKDVRDGRMVFEPNLKANLDEADRVYNGINALIDRHIADKGIDAASGRRL